MLLLSRFATIVLATALAGCAVPQPETRVVTLGARYDVDAMNWAKNEGTATIEGQAVLRTRGGEPKSCAGVKVYLIPYSLYGMQRLVNIYGNDEHGFITVGEAMSRRVRFEPDVPAYKADAREQACDSQGNFRFDRLPAGKWWLQTHIVWQVGALNQGGSLLQAVEVKDGEVRRVVIAQ
ncbi:hypothetical protein [Cupriavidus pauculus]|uniref:hypothetical protein n=1 Tax=Cupriavidus pauculus TaxID=82633 RepID=UPI003857D5DB